MNKPNLLILSGFAGVGKDTVLRVLLKNDPRFSPSISYSTRTPRNGEIDGVDYYFVSREVFQKKAERGDFLEYTEFCGNFYGTPKSEIERNAALGKVTVLEIETDGAGQVMGLTDNYISVFLASPDFATLENRLRGRKSETEESIRLRMAKARNELLLLPKYQHVLVNLNQRSDDVAKTISELFFEDSISHPELKVNDIDAFIHKLLND